MLLFFCFAKRKTVLLSFERTVLTSRPQGVTGEEKEEKNSSSFSVTYGLVRPEAITLDSVSQFGMASAGEKKKKFHQLFLKVGI